MKKILTLAMILSIAPTIIAQTFTYNGAPDAIPDNDVPNPLCTVINVPAGLASDLDHLTIVMEHTWLGDLQIDLTSPSGDSASFGAFGAGTFGDGSDLSFDFPIDWGDAFAAPAATLGASPADCGTSDIQGDPGTVCTDTQFAPDTAFSTLTGTAVGDWTLCIGDRAEFDTGRLQSWSLVGNGSLPVELQNFSVE
ncbi:MAG: proprotein convertase P-domain-containing protein [Proteobacteria bacterium]|nr:proprotein convertase P-domain-containing protein [Pseudomonadota bacterium]